MYDCLFLDEVMLVVTVFIFENSLLLHLKVFVVESKVATAPVTHLPLR